MGGGESVEHHHHYITTNVVPPETVEKLAEQEVKIQEFEELAKSQGDPNLYTDNASKLLDTFLDNVESLKLTDLIKKETGENHVACIGPVSAGKTSFINASYGLNVPVAMGHCAGTCDVVYKDVFNVIWDVQGENNDFKWYDPNNLSFIKDLDKCLIMFDNDISMISNIIKVVYAINKNILVIRTKCDLHSQFDHRSIEEEKKLDKKKLNELLGLTENQP